MITMRDSRTTVRSHSPATRWIPARRSPETETGGQIWVKGEPKVRLYSTVEATFAALKQIEAEGKIVRVTFVHDRTSGNKLFADKVWYVNQNGKLSAFLLKDAAVGWAAKNNGSVLAYDDARNTLADQTAKTAHSEASPPHGI